MDKFSLAPAFAATSHPVADMTLCAARLQDDARWPWIVLVSGHDWSVVIRAGWAPANSSICPPPTALS